MKILFVASELTPIAKVGGLGDVIGALPKALSRLGIESEIVMPRYHFIPLKTLRLIKRGIKIQFAKTSEKITLYQCALPKANVKVFLIENRKYLSTGPGPYFESSGVAGMKKEIERFIFFSKAVFVLLRKQILKSDIIHANDWHTGALVALARKSEIRNPEKGRGPLGTLRPKSETPKIIFTIHNLGNQGRWNVEEINQWFWSKNEKPIFKKFGNDYNLIAEGILNADWVTAVSPAYSREILTREYGQGLEKIIQSRRRNLTGILNGIDYDFWNPQKDRFLSQTYSEKTANLKSINKSVLQRSLKLKNDLTLPLFGLVARLTDQKGIDLITAGIKAFLKKYPSQFVFLGRGSTDYETALLKLAKEFPQAVYTKIGFDEPLAHRIYAASDFFLMPSRFEPSGLGQMIAMRYGTIPVVRSTGGLKDTVRHLKTGFVFKHAKSEEFWQIAGLAWNYYLKHQEELSVIQKNCFKENFDFNRSAREYKNLYEKVLKL